MKYISNSCRIGVVIALAIPISQGLWAAPIINDSAHADMLAMKAKALVNHQSTTTPPGNQTQRLRSRRGGPQAARHQEAGCGGIAVGNVRPIVGDHRSHKTTVIIQGHVYNTGNRC